MVLCCCAAVALCAGYHPPEPEYVFIPDTARRVVIFRQQMSFFGTLDTDGNFHEELRIGFEKSGSFQKGTCTPIGRRGPAYEYRAGKLVKGVIGTDGMFVPDPNAPVTHFINYKYSPDAVPIWNLPGYFMRKDKLDDRRKWLSEHAAEDPAYRAEKAKLDAAAAGKGGTR
jgi:hypothetical protein